MGDKDASSSAAQSAHPPQPKVTPPLPTSAPALEQAPTSVSGSEPTGFLARIQKLFGTRRPPDAASTPPSDAHMPAPRGMNNLRRLRVDDVAIPTADIVAVPDTITQDELADVFRESGLTRLPVFRGTLDTPIGIAHLKDFALTHGFNQGADAFSLETMVRPLMYVPPSMSIGVLLTKMQSERRHMALVIDEYGGVDGLVTIEDLIEQVIGEIEDEHDTSEDAYWTKEKPGTYVALSKTPLEEFESEIGQSLTRHDSVDEEEIDTLGGLVFMLAGRVPARGEVVSHPEGPEFEVMEADARRIKRLRVRLTPGPAE